METDPCYCLTPVTHSMQRGGKRKWFLPLWAAGTTVKKEMANDSYCGPPPVFVFALTMSVSAFAGSTKTDTVTLYHDAQMNGKTLPAGDYTVKCETTGSNAQVKFLKSGKEVASANGQAKTAHHRPPITIRLSCRTVMGRKTNHQRNRFQP